MEELQRIRDDHLADDIPIPDEAVAWIESEAVEYFESGGFKVPRESGLEGAEVHAYYELAQKRVEHLETDDMLGALGAALFKVSGDEEFRPLEPEPEPEPKPKEDPAKVQQKYAVPTIPDAPIYQD